MKKIIVQIETEKLDSLLTKEFVEKVFGELFVEKIFKITELTESTLTKSCGCKPQLIYYPIYYERPIQYYPYWRNGEIIC